MSKPPLDEATDALLEQYLSKKRLGKVRTNVADLPDSQFRDIELGRAKNLVKDQERALDTRKTFRKELFMTDTPPSDVDELNIDQDAEVEAEKTPFQKVLYYADSPARHLVRRPIAAALGIDKANIYESSSFHDAVKKKADEGSIGAKVLDEGKKAAGKVITHSVLSPARMAGTSLSKDKDWGEKFDRGVGNLAFDFIDPLFAAKPATAASRIAKAGTKIADGTYVANGITTKLAPAAKAVFKTKLDAIGKMDKTVESFDHVKDLAKQYNIPLEAVTKHFGKQGEHFGREALGVFGKEVGIGKAVGRAADALDIANPIQKMDKATIVGDVNRKARALKRNTHAKIYEDQKNLLEKARTSGLSVDSTKKVVESLVGKGNHVLNPTESAFATELFKHISDTGMRLGKSGPASIASVKNLLEKGLVAGDNLPQTLARFTEGASKDFAAKVFTNELRSQFQRLKPGYQMSTNEINLLAEQSFPKFLAAAKKLDNTGVMGQVARGIEIAHKGWKTAKLAFTPAYYIMNGWGDGILMAMNGVNPAKYIYKADKLFRQAAKGNARAKAILDQAAEYGIGINEKYQHLELAGNSIKESAKGLQKSLTGSPGMGGVRGALDNTSDKVASGWKKIPGVKYVPVSPTHGVWQENVYKLAMFLDGTDKGMTGAASAKRAFDTLIDYDKYSVSDRLKWLFPFIKYMVNSPVAAGRTLAKNPGKFLIPEKVNKNLSEPQDTPPLKKMRETGTPFSSGSATKELMNKVNRDVGGEDVVGSLYTNPRIGAYEALASVVNLVGNVADGEGKKGLTELVRRMGPIPQLAHEEQTGKEIETGARKAARPIKEKLATEVIAPSIIPRPILDAINIAISRNGGPDNLLGTYKNVDGRPENTQAAKILSTLFGIYPMEVGPTSEQYESKHSPKVDYNLQRIEEFNRDEKAKREREQRRARHKKAE